MGSVRARSLSCLLDASESEDNCSMPRQLQHAYNPRQRYRDCCGRTGRGFMRFMASRGDGAIALYLILALIVVGSTLSFVLPASDELHGPYRKISAIIGWTYFCSWSVSFYPQVLLNYQRKTSVGVSFDFLMYNVLAFSCYAAFTCSLFWSKSVQNAYNRRHAGQPNKVQLNDAVFALHAVLISTVTLGQAMYYDWRSGKQRPSFAAILVCWIILGCASVYAFVVSIKPEARQKDKGIVNWLDFLYFLSYVKVGTGILKYVPQVVLNATRRSTKGWTIWNVILDLTGGLLSVLQLVLDCWNTGDWSGIRGYPVKFAIGLVSFVFDLIFMLQHYLLYPQPPTVEATDRFLLSTSGASAPLLQDHNAHGRRSLEDGYME